MILNLLDKNWSLPQISRTIVIGSLLAQLVMILLEVKPWQHMPASGISGIVLLVIIFSPNVVLAALSYTVKGRSIKSWIIFALSVFLVITTLPIYVHTFYFVPEIPQNAQAGVIIILLPIYQILAGAILGGIAWGIASYRSKG